MADPFGVDGTPTVWNQQGGEKIYPADAFTHDSRGLVTQTHVSDAVHRGEIYLITHIFDAVINNGSAIMMFVSGADKDLHIVISASLVGDNETFVFRDVTFSAAGTEITPRNQNFNFPDAADFQVFINPTITDFGTQILERWNPLGSGGQATGGAGGGRVVEYVVPAGGNSYIGMATNLSGQSRKYSFISEIHEHDLDP